MSQPRRSTRSTTSESTHESESHSHSKTTTTSRKRKGVKSPNSSEEDIGGEGGDGEGDKEEVKPNNTGKKVKKEAEEVCAEEEEETKTVKNDSGAVYMLDEDTKEPKDDIPKAIAESGDLPPSSFGEVNEKNSERKHGNLERGHIYFIYRPKVELEEANSVDDISRLQILLLPSPEKNEGDKKNYRLIVVGRKRIPKTGSGGKEVLWGKVIGVSNSFSALREKLGPKTYETKTLGERHLAPARIVARGHYILTSPSSNLESVPEGSKNMSAVYKTYLAYSISVPNQLGDVQHEMRIEEQGAFGLQIRNPNSKSNNPVVRDPKDSQKPAYPKLLSSLFTTKFIPANPVSLLDFAGAEILMIGTSHSVEENIGKEALKELEEGVDNEQRELYGETKDEEEEEGEEGEAVNEEAARKALEELGMAKSGIIEALEGHWA